MCCWLWNWPVHLQVSCTCCWNTWWIDTTCTMPTCLLNWTRRSTQELSPRWWLPPSSASSGCSSSPLYAQVRCILLNVDVILISLPVVHAGIHGTVIKWLKSSKGVSLWPLVTSQLVPLCCGVPQGSILGTIHFSLNMYSLWSVIVQCNSRLCLAVPEFSSVPGNGWKDSGFNVWNLTDLRTHCLLQEFARLCYLSSLRSSAVCCSGNMRWCYHTTL